MRVTAILVLFSATVLGQKWIMRSVAGGGPAGIPAVEASLNRPVALCGPFLVARDAGRVFRLEPDGGLSIAAEDLEVPVACALHSVDGLYIAEAGAQRVRRLDADGRLTAIASLEQPAALAVDGNGNLYAAAARGVYRLTQPAFVKIADANAHALAIDPQGRPVWAERDQNRLRRLETNGQIITIASADAPRAIAFDMLGVLHVADAKRVRRLDTGAVVAEADAAGVAFDAANALLTVEDGAHRVRRWANGRATLLAGNGTPAFSGDGGPAENASLFNPQGLWANSNELLIGDTGNQAVRRVDLDTGLITTLTRANQPWGVTRDTAGNILIGEPDRVRRLTPAGVLGVLAGGGSVAADVTLAAQARLLEPIAVTADDEGNVFLAERANNKLRRVTPDGGLATIAGTGQLRVPDTETGYALSMPVARPPAIAFDGSALFYADDNAHVVGRIENGRLEIVAGTRSPATGPAPDGPAIATKTPLLAPRGVAPDYGGGFFISESTPGRIRHVDSDGILRTVVEPGTLRRPSHLAFAPPCTLYVADSGNHLIRRLRPEVRFTVRPEPAHLLLNIDGETVTGERTFSWEGFTQHVLLAPSPQEPSEGTRYLAPPAQLIDLACVPAEQALVVTFAKQHLLTVEASEGGTVSPGSGWINAGDDVTLTAAARDGFVFTNWEGACKGAGACTIRLDAPQRVKANFATLTP